MPATVSLCNIFNLYVSLQKCILLWLHSLVTYVLKSFMQRLTITVFLWVFAYFNDSLDCFIHFIHVRLQWIMWFVPQGWWEQTEEPSLYPVLIDIVWSVQLSDWPEYLLHGWCLVWTPTRGHPWPHWAPLHQLATILPFQRQ